MWNSDNVIFNVNGGGLNRLTNTLTLALSGEKVAGWKFIKEKGIVLYSYVSSSNKDVNKFPSPLSADGIAPLVYEWLQSDDAKTVPTQGWDANADHDGENELGWRVYTEDWGHINGEWNAIAIKPAYLWYGK